MNIILIGMPGSGKTSVAEEYKKRGGKVFDTDRLIEEEYGNISEIFSTRGEEYFRTLETEVIKKVCKKDDILISTGGGSVLKAENVELFKKSGKIVYLETSLKELSRRLEKDETRPLLKGGVDKLRLLYEARTPIYERVADIKIKTDGLSVSEVLDKLLLKIK